MFFILHLVFTYFKNCSLPSTQFIFLTSTEVYKVQEDDLKKKTFLKIASLCYRKVLTTTEALSQPESCFCHIFIPIKNKVSVLHDFIFPLTLCTAEEENFYTET